MTNSLNINLHFFVVVLFCFLGGNVYWTYSTCCSNWIIANYQQWVYCFTFSSQLRAWSHNNFAETWVYSSDKWFNRTYNRSTHMHDQTSWYHVSLHCITYSKMLFILINFEQIVHFSAFISIQSNTQLNL